MTSDSPVVIVDTREPKAIATQLRAYGLTVVEDMLEAGDFCFFPHSLKVGIERKQISDLLNSLRDKRMVSQAHKMIETYDTSLLLVEGRYDRSPTGVVMYEAGGQWFDSGWSWDSFTGMMLDLAWMGLIRHQCMSGDAAREIARIVGSLCKEEHAWIRQRERPVILSIDSQYKNACWGLCAFAGVGPEWADAMLKHFGTFASVVASDAKGLAEVVNSGGKRFGPKRAAKLRKEWEETWTIA